MNTIEAIAWVRSLTAFFNYPANCDIQKDSDALKNSEKADQIVELLQHGEEYKILYGVLCDNVGIIPKETKK